MMGRSSEVSLSRFGHTSMENVRENNGSYSVGVQGIDRSKISNYQEIYIFLWESLFSMTGNGPLNTPLLWNLPMESAYY